MDSEESSSVSLPSELVTDLRERAEATGYEDVDEYVEQILTAVLAEVESIETTTDEEDVKNRLKSLGYLDQ
ncbi:hypothetical protein ACOZ4N_11290 [Halorientalis pallida]|uniref:hypothetical protein n=1 Tax=Halorientalis pallida TaxID=2479928 RepID=UPI003C6F4749